jgi:uncharacterized protein (DUF433 family)
MTRTVELMLQKLAADETVERIPDAHPRLTRLAILAALDFDTQDLRTPLRP